MDAQNLNFAGSKFPKNVGFPAPLFYFGRKVSDKKKIENLLFIHHKW